MNLLAKLPNDGSADPLSVVYDVDLTIPADKVVSLDLMLMVMVVMVLMVKKRVYVFFLAGRTISHGNRCSQLNPRSVQRHHRHHLVAIIIIIILITIMMIIITRRVTSPLSCRVDHRHSQVWGQPLRPHIYRFIMMTIT